MNGLNVGNSNLQWITLYRNESFYQILLGRTDKKFHYTVYRYEYVILIAVDLTTNQSIKTK